MIQLNPAQMAAVTADDGPSLVLAGAGSGKTRVIIERMAWLVEERGVDPRNLLALTFTNKAAAEMRERFAQRIEVDRVASWLGTFHSFGLFVLRREMDKLGRKKSFTVFDDSDQLSLMKRLVRELPTSLKKVSPREALTWISQLKQQVETPPESEEELDAAELSYRELWKRYHAALGAASAVDFDDLLGLLVQIFQEHPEVREKYQRRYRYVLIDEYQDTNRAQYLIARLLTEGHGNLFVVGDEDQSIYSWRGADINNILDFADDFPEAKVFKLEQNYRSTRPVLDVANKLVANNVNRLGKELWTEQAQGDPVTFYLAEDAEDEARYVVSDFVKQGCAPKEVAVLYRTNTQARMLEEVLRTKGVHYIVIGGIKFYARKEIKDILAYLRLLVNPDDDESLRRIINVPARGIGNTTMERIEEYAALRRQPLLQVLHDLETDETFTGRARNAAQAFVQIIDDLALEAKNSSIADLVESLLEKTDYRAFVETSDEKDFRNRLEIVDEFVASCSQYDARNERGGGLLEFLQDLALMTDVDDWDRSQPAVTLMTCHAAKGLEFDHVYLVGLEEELLPFVQEFDSDRDVEEERRLCYVAMTRARKRLTLTAAQQRMIYGTTRYDRAISRFVREAGLDARPRSSRSGGPARRRATPREPVKQEKFKVGARVRHGRFGTGTVLYTSGSGDKLRARIRFQTGKSVMLMVSKAPIEVIEGR